MTTALDTYTPLPGDIGLVTMGGETGKLIRLGQWLDGDGFENFEHAFVYLGPDKIIEAEPGGAQIRDFHYDLKTVHWCTGIAKLWTPENRTYVPSVAVRYFGTPYSAADYFALVAKRLRLPGYPLLKNYVATSKHQICSQLADQIAYDCGVRIFDDGRWPGDVTPGSLYERDLQLGK
jgi:hypothetical protein